MAEIRSKLPEAGTTIFTVMSQLANDCNAINLSQGFPDFAVPDALLESVARHMRQGHNQYAPMTGVAELREAIAGKVQQCYARKLDPTAEVTVTSGATEALFAAIQGFVHRGDEVIVFDPAYDSYDPAIRLAGGVPVHIPLHPDDFSPDWNRVEHALNQRTAMIIVNTPHNPTGSIWNATDRKTLAALLRDSRVVVLSDEVYEHIVFDGNRHESMLLDDELAERSVVVSSFGKTCHATGWKIGYCCAPVPLMREFRRIHQFVQFCVVTPMQYALAEFTVDHPEHYRQLGAFYASKRDRFADLLKASRFTLRPSRGTYFQLADYAGISDLNDIEFTRWMTTEKGVAAIPISVFYDQPPRQHLVRFCFAKSDATLEQAAEQLCQI